MKSTFQSHSLVPVEHRDLKLQAQANLLVMLFIYLMLLLHRNMESPSRCSFPMTGAPSTCPPSVPLDSKSGSSLFPSSQPVGEEPPYLPPVELLDSTIEMWERVVANEKTDQEVTDEGLRHFYEASTIFVYCQNATPGNDVSTSMR